MWLLNFSIFEMSISIFVHRDLVSPTSFLTVRRQTHIRNLNVALYPQDILLKGIPFLIYAGKEKTQMTRDWKVTFS